MNDVVELAIKGNAGIAFLGMLYVAIAAKRVNNQFPGFHPKYYPDRYTIPHYAVRKILHLKNEMMPKWMYIYMLSFFVHIPLFVLSSILILCVQNEQFIAIVVLINFALILGLRIYFIVCNVIYMNPSPTERIKTFFGKLKHRGRPE